MAAHVAVHVECAATARVRASEGCRTGVGVDVVAEAAGTVEALPADTADVLETPVFVQVVLLSRVAL